jgi:lon-related putative ATP-dependent protease
MSTASDWMKYIMPFKRNKADGSAGHSALPAALLRRKVDPAVLGFGSTRELEPIDGLIGQERALKAIELGVNIRQRDFNLFVLGPPESGKSTAVRTFLEKKCAASPAPPDWVYVNNFLDPDKPRAHKLPKGRAERLAKAMIETIEELKTGLPSVFEGDDYQTRRRAIDEEFRGGQEQAFEAIAERAKSQSVALLRTPNGFAMAPMHEGKVIEREVFETLPEATRKEFERKIETLQKELEKVIEELPRIQKERRKRLQTLNEEFAELVVRQAIGDVQAEFDDLSEIKAYLAEAKQDLIRNVGIFLAEGEEASGMVSQPVDTVRDARFRRYLVNVIVSHGAASAGAPIVEELNPVHGNLIGRVEHIARMGALLTDFLLIKPGALHRANGGYLLIDARKLLTAPFAWEALKRALKSHEIKIEAPAEAMGLISTQSLEPDPIPLDLKVVLFGDRQLYYLLAAYDPDFQRLFKVQADFDETIDRDNGNHLAYARLIASIVKTHALKPVDASGVARLIEEGSRLADDSRKLSLEIGKLADVIREADYWAEDAGREMITRADVSRAINESIHRADRARDKTNESFAREIMLLDTSGAKVGQINGLSVLSLANFTFGRPSRITARVRIGQGRVTDIEREVELGGPLHSKGVMILWGFLAGRYAQDVPLALAASLVFEQSYGGVDGDSASSTELYALLSTLSEVPIRQSFAVTGSVNQHGEVQAIGGVNEKIEGFFDVCRERGLDGSQGVLIPAANTQHLMLRNDVVEAVRQGKFAVHAVSHVDQGIALLTGLPAGERGADGRFAEGSINRKVEDRLREFASKAKAFGKGDDDKAGSKVS